MKKIGLFALNTGLTLAGGWILSIIVIAQSGDLPDWMESALQAALRIAGQEKFSNPVDLPALGMSVILIASIIVCALIVWIANVAIRRTRTRQV